MIRSIIYSIALMLILTLAQSGAPVGNVLSNVLEAKSATSPYKKTFSRSKRKRSKSKRRSSINSCVQWNANKINDKASQFNVYIDQSSRKYRVDKSLIKAVITAESCFKVKALSNKGAQGLMQLIPATAKRFGVRDSYKPSQNIRGGTRYLRFLMDRFSGNLTKVIAAYNAGEGAVDKYKGIPPYKETKQYVKNVLKVYSVLNPHAHKKAKKAVYRPVAIGKKAGRQGWQYNRALAPHLYKK